MNIDQTTAFNSASGTTVGELQVFILTLTFTITCIWAVVMFMGKLQSFKKGGEIDFTHMVFVSLRILAVVVIILFLTNL